MGRLGVNPSAPLVKGRTGSLDKKPWKNLPPPHAPVEGEFLRPVYLGELIAPYRLLEPVLAVIPWDKHTRQLLTSEMASRQGYSKLSSWLAKCEDLWQQHGKGKISFIEKLDFYHLLSVQFPIGGPRIVYSKAGNNPAAAMIDDCSAVIDHKLYWGRMETREEGRYLIALFNSETARARVEKWQSMGQWGARDFDKVMFNLPIPRFDPNVKLHRDLAEAAERAEKVAAIVPRKEGEYFTRTRKRIRDALRADGVADEIDGMVERLLETKPQQIAA